MVLRYRHTGRTGYTQVVALILAVVVLLSVNAAAQRSDEVAVIAHLEVPADTIQPQRLLDFYSLDIRNWGGDVPVVVFDLRINGPIRDAFYEYLGKSSARMKSTWLKKMLSGEADPPEALKDEQEMVRRVATTEGAIGYVSRSAVTDSVKVLVTIRLDE